MKKLLLILTLSILGTALFAQTPQAINYQGVARDGSGNVLTNQSVALKLSLLQGSASGTAIYIETHSKTTDAFGLFALQIGQGSVVSGVFSTISWGSNTYYLKVEIDPAGGTAWQLVGTNQFVAVPYALYAKESGTAGPTGPTGPAGTDGADGADGANGDRYAGISTTSLSIGLGAKSLVVGTNLSYSNGQTVVIANSSSNYMIGVVTGYNSGTGLLNVTSNAVTGSGTFSLWNVNLSGAVGPQGSVGATGAQGIQGIQGIQGTTGTQGTQGIQGIQGPTGNATISGTTNYVVKFTGATVGGNSQIFDNGTNVGIGTTSPTFKIDVVGADARFNGITVGRGASSISSNTAIGYLPLNANTTGGFNTAVGYRVLYNNTEGQVNCGLGYNSLYNNTTGTDNTAMGYYSLYSNKANSKNTALGAYAMFYADNTTTGAETHNTAVGHSALRGSSNAVNNIGTYNTAIGSQAMYSNTDGFFNTACGFQSLTTNSTGYANTAFGGSTLIENTTGSNNMAIGADALYDNTSGSYNVAVGGQALRYNKANSRSTAIGQEAMYFADNRTTGRETYNTAVGFQALQGSIPAANNTGQFNTAVGDQALQANTSGSYNTAIGYRALNYNTVGDYRTAIGYYANSFLADYDNNTGVGYDANPSATNTIHIGNTSITSIKGQVGFTTYSDGRFKKNIQENEVKGLEFIKKLRPVTYNCDITAYARWEEEHYGVKDSANWDSKYDIEKIRFSGFIAQEVEQAANELGYDFSGVDKPKNENDFYGLRYAEFVVPLVKGMQEQQQQIEDLKKIVEQQQKLIEQLLNK